MDRNQRHPGRQPKIPCPLPNNIRFLSTSEQLLEELIRDGDDGSLVVVLHLPAPDWHNLSVDDSIDEISNQFSNLLEPSSSAANRQSERRRQRFLFATLAEFSNWVTCDNQETTNVHYVVFYDKHIAEPAIRLYEGGSGNFISMSHNIPKAPGKVAIKMNCPGVFTLSWAVEKEDNIITSYLLQYQLGGCGESWNSIQHPTNTIVLDNLRPNEIYYFRVAAVTRIGRSPFSLVSSEVRIDQRTTEIKFEAGEQCSQAIGENQPSIILNLNKAMANLHLDSWVADNSSSVENIKMAALGRRFQLGNLYDYRNDRATSMYLSIL